MNWSELTWQNGHLWWVVPVGVGVVALGFLLVFLWRQRMLERIADPALRERLVETLSRPRQVLKAVIMTVAVALLLLAALRPQYGVRETEVRNVGIDIAVLLDASQSMLVRDVVPDRFVAARQEISRVLEGLSGGRVALIPFYFIPFVQSPLTSDFDALQVYLRDLRLDDIAEPEMRGTSIGRALMAAVGLLAQDRELLSEAGAGVVPDLDEDHDVSAMDGSRYKAILLFTDGEEHEDLPEEIYTVAESAGIRIFSVGVGTRAGHAVPIVQEDGEVTGVLKGEDGHPIFSALNEELLGGLAERTGGAYFNFSGRSVADELLAEIEKLEKKEFEAQTRDLGEDRYQFLLLPALLLLMVEGLMSDRLRRRRATDDKRRQGKRGRRRLGALVMALVLLAGPQAVAWDLFKTRQSDVEAGNALLRSGSPREALEAYERAREVLPEQAELHYAIGVARHELGEYDMAVRALERALERLPDLGVAEETRELRFAVLFALGTTYAAWGERAEARALGRAAPEEEEGPEPRQDARTKAIERFERAVHFLERALRFEPGHEGALLNLELALLRVDPPCHLRNDEYAPNDTFDSAAALEVEDLQEEQMFPLVLCPGEDDWFTFETEPGDRIFASVKTDNRAAELRVALYAPDGVRVRPPAGSERTISELSYQEGALAGPVRLHVFDPTEEESDYRLKLRVLPACERLDDSFEPNDSFEEARLVTDEDRERLAALRLCPGNDDWFKIDVPDEWSLMVIGEFDIKQGLPELAIFDEQQNELMRRSFSSEEAQVDDSAPLMLSLLEPPPGRYRLKVTGTLDVEAAYGLTLQVVPPCPEGDDHMEPNDEFGEAKPFPEGEPMLLRRCPDNDDWFEVMASGDERRVVTALFDHESGDLALELYDSKQQLVGESDQSSAQMGGEALVLPEVPEEDEVPYYVRVTSHVNESNFYLLELRAPDADPDAPDDERDEQDEQDERDEQDRQDERDERDEQDRQDERDERDEQDELDAMREEMEKLDRNPRNLEAERARRTSPLGNARPTKPW